MHKREPGYIITILINLVMIYLAYYLRDHRPFFLTGSYVTVLPAIIISLCVTILAHAAFLVYDRAWFRHLVQIGQHIVSILVMVVIYVIFPFALGQPWPLLVRILLILGLIGTGIGVLVELAALVKGREDGEERHQQKGPVVGAFFVMMRDGVKIE